MNNSIKTDYNIEDTGALLTRSAGSGRSKRIIIIAAAAIAVLAIALVGWKLLGDKRYNDRLEIAEKEFVEGNYEQAEVEYLKAVEMKKRKPKAREGLAYTYAVLEKWDDSKKTYLELYDDTEEKKYEEAAEEVAEERLPSNPELIPGRKMPNQDKPNAAKTKDAYAAYADILKEYERYIKSYWWQHDSDNETINKFANGYMPEIGEDNLGYVENASNKCVVVEDLNADGTPELMFFTAKSGYSAPLHIYTFDGNYAIELDYKKLAERYEGGTLFSDEQASSGTRYMLYTDKKGESLYLAYSIGGLKMGYHLYQFKINGKELDTEKSVENWYSEEPGSEMDAYSVDGIDVSPKEGIAVFKELGGSYDKLLMFSGYDKNISVFEKVKSDTPSAMTYDEAMKMLQGE